MKIILRGKQLSTQHIYGTSGHGRYMKPEAKKLKDSYILQARMQYKGNIIYSNLKVEIKLYFVNNQIRDWDNWHKLSMDALESIVYRNDSQIKDSRVIFCEPDKLNPRIEIEINSIEK